MESNRGSGLARLGLALDAVPPAAKAVGMERLDRSGEPLRHPKALTRSPFLVVLGFLPEAQGD
jgi:hypothetical protein